MTAKLSPRDIGFFRENGYLAPIDALSPAEAAHARQQLERHEAAYGRLAGSMLHRPHLLFTWAAAIVRHPGILVAVEDILGPDLLVWSCGFFIKEALDRRFVSWHQDSTYWGMEPADVVTAWLALSDSNSDNGAMRVIPGTHRLDQLAHRQTQEVDNMLSRGQEIAVDVSEADAVTLELAPGQISLHDVKLVHGSEPNLSERRRIGLAIRYIPTHVRQTMGTRDTASLVRGIDTFGHFEPEPRPAFDLAPEAVAFHAWVCESKTAAQDAAATQKSAPSLR